MRAHLKIAPGFKFLLPGVGCGYNVQICRVVCRIHVCAWGGTGGLGHSCVPTDPGWKRPSPARCNSGTKQDQGTQNGRGGCCFCCFVLCAPKPPGAAPGSRAARPSLGVAADTTHSHPRPGPSGRTRNDRTRAAFAAALCDKGLLLGPICCRKPAALEEEQLLNY